MITLPHRRAADSAFGFPITNSLRGKLSLAAKLDSSPNRC